MNNNLVSIIKKNELKQKNIFFSSKKNPFDCTSDLHFLLESAIKSKKPFSMIRLGDGEGRILGFPSVFEDIVYLNQVLTYQFGPNVINALKNEHGIDFLDKSMSNLKGLITDAIKTADIIGVPSWLHFKAELNSSNLIPQTAQSVCLEFTEIASEKCVFFDHFIFKPFHQNGFFLKLLNGLENLTVISHTDISSKIQNTFNVKKCKHIKIPGHQSFMKSDVLHYPVEYKTICSNLRVDKPGDLFLVAAGYLGKHYCNVIKSKGGIAIDIGSIFDGWCGVGRSDAIENESHRL